MDDIWVISSFQNSIDREVPQTRTLRENESEVYN